MAVFAAALYLFSWNAQSALAGKKPEKKFDVNAHKQQQPHAKENLAKQGEITDPELVALGKAAKEKPLDLALQKQYAGRLIEKIKTSEQLPPALIFETIDSLGTILKIDPNDRDALIAMADISFDQQAFSKASEFYKQYLELEKNDHNARARYASSLTFMGQFEEALSELNKVLKAEPENFHARAYMAITYAQMGKHPEAREMGQKALALAPSDEAKERFRQFLDSLDREAAGSEAPKRGNLSHFDTIVETVKNNPVAGPKFVDHYISTSGDLVLLVRDFPMDKMPPFVKDKFLNGIKAVAETVQRERPFKVILREETTNRDLEVLEVK